MEINVKIENLSLTKEKLDKCFEAFNATVSEDADLLLEYIGKKADLEIEKRLGFRFRRRTRRPINSKLLNLVNSNLIEFTQEIIENSPNNYIEIQAIRRSLRKFCPLWPIC